LRIAEFMGNWTLFSVPGRRPGIYQVLYWKVQEIVPSVL